MKQFYITYRNLGRPEKTPILGDTEEWARHNVELLTVQGTTSIRVHWRDNTIDKLANIGYASSEALKRH